MSERFRYRVRVQYQDTDQGGVVHHAAYLRFMEQARVELLRERGVNYRRFEEEVGKGIPVVEVRARYRRPARFDDLLELETWVSTCNRAKLVFEYRVFRGEELLTEASITCACVLMAEQRICSMDPLLRAAFP
ncbi:MAG: acyl-CoA thioesterase [Sandaracinaceae bacterium]